MWPRSSSPATSSAGNQTIVALFQCVQSSPSLVVLLLLTLQQQAGAQLHPAGRGQGLELSRGLQQANSPAVCYGKYTGKARGKMGQRGWYRGREATEGAGMLGID